MCKDGCEIEIKTQTMMITLAPCRHRKDRELEYTQTGIKALAEESMLYDMLINELKLADCFLFGGPDEYHAKRSEEAKFSIDEDVERADIAEPQIVKGIEIILGQDDKNITDGSPFKSAYIVQHRHDVVISLAGLFIYNYVTLESSREFIRKLGEAAGDSAEDIRNSLRKVQLQYERALGKNPKPVRGKQGLIEAFMRAHKNNSQSEAEQRLKYLTKELRLERNHPKSNSSRENDADTLVKIVEEKIGGNFFVNHMNRACALVPVNSHFEIMELKEEPFLEALRIMWRKSSDKRITISEDMLKRARAALIAATNQFEHQRIEMHKRVAWKVKNDVMRYDLTNSLWQEIEVDGNGVRLLSSDTMLEEFKDYKESVANEVMKLINDYVMDPENKARKQEKRPWHYWICQKQPGQLSEVMENLLAKKRDYKLSGQKLKEKATKILMNSGYGVFASAYFKYNDIRVAELITGYGQYTIKELEKYAGNRMVYGDTDSIYLKSKDDTIIAKAAELDVTLEFERVWKGLFLSHNKKQYFGLTEDGKVIWKGFKGMKSDQPK